MIKNIKLLSLLLLILINSLPSYADNLNTKMCATLTVNDLYVLSDSDFYLIFHLEKEDKQRINNMNIKCTLFLPKEMRLLSQSELDYFGRLVYSVHVASLGAETKIGLYIENRTNGEKTGYWVKFNNTIVLSPADRAIKDISPKIAFIGLIGAAVSSLIDFASCFNMWYPKKLEFSPTTIGLLIVAMCGAISEGRVDSIISENSKTTFEQIEGTKDMRIILNNMNEEELNYCKKLIEKPASKGALE